MKTSHCLAWRRALVQVSWKVCKNDKENPPLVFSICVPPLPKKQRFTACTNYCAPLLYLKGIVVLAVVYTDGKLWPKVVSGHNSPREVKIMFLVNFIFGQQAGIVQRYVAVLLITNGPILSPSASCCRQQINKPTFVFPFTLSKAMIYTDNRNITQVTPGNVPGTKKGENGEGFGM